MQNNQEQTEAPLLVNYAEAARLLGLGRSTIYELVNEGELPTVQVGRSVRISRSDLTAWIEQQKQRK